MSGRGRVPLPLFGALLVTVALAAAIEGTRARPPAPCRVAILGIDGATWKAIDPLVARGLMPAFAALKASGATGDLLSLPPFNSPQMWTTIATGQPPSVHGIQNFTMPGPAGKPIPSSSNLRRVAALWNMASARGRSVAVVSWYVTWPAEAVRGDIVSDHVRPAEESAIFWPVTAEQERHLPGRTFPPGLLDEIRPLLVTADAVDRPAMKEDLGFFGVKHPYLGDETTMRCAAWLEARRHPALLMLYQHGTDVMGHLSYGPFDEWLRGGADSRGARRVVDYYRYEDDNLARLVRLMGGRVDGGRIALPPRTAIVVVSDHGFGPGKRPLQPALTGDHRPQGILGIVGPPARAGAAVAGASVLDVAPTVLHLMGLPVARDLPGRVLVEALAPAYGAPAPRTLAHDEFRPAGGDAMASPADDAILEELRALGYIR